MKKLGTDQVGIVDGRRITRDEARAMAKLADAQVEHYERSGISASELSRRARRLELLAEGEALPPTDGD